MNFSDEDYDGGWCQPVLGNSYHYYKRGKEIPVCGSSSWRYGYDKDLDRDRVFDVIPSPEFLELFGDKNLKVCEKCYKKICGR